MNRKILYPFFFALSALISSCRDTDTKAIQLTQDSTAAGSGSGSGKKTTSSDSTTIASSNNGSSLGDSSVNKKIAVKPLTGDVKSKTSGKAAKKKTLGKDSAAVASGDDDNSPAIKKAKIATADNTKIQANTSSIAGKAFVSKYGTIPRNATQDNITDFLTAFTDKTIFIKIYYNADPDADMQNVKAQVVKVLNKSGYNNISDQSLTLHPIHVPKDIHYELQHDGSVVIWIPPASTD
jgi:hypothetical protein